MTMKNARNQYRRLFSTSVDVSKTEAPQLERVWKHDAPGFKAWAREELKKADIKSAKLRRIVGRGR